jgi:hypothetical protein
MLQFCADEVQQDNADAYALLSTTHSGLHGDVSVSQFVQTLQQRDQRYGPVQACVVTGQDYVGTLLSFGSGALQVKVTLGDGVHVGADTVVNDGGWKIESIGAQLYLDG